MRSARNHPIARLRNIGPKTAAWLAGIGIETEADLRRVGAAAAYRRLKHERPREVTLVCLYALHAALTGRHWNDLPAEVKQQLRAEAGEQMGGRKTRRPQAHQRANRGISRACAAATKRPS